MSGRDGARAGWTGGGSRWEDESGGGDDKRGPAGEAGPCGGKPELELWQFPASPGRQQEHRMPSRTQAHRRHLAVPLHRQHRRIGRQEAGRREAGRREAGAGADAIALNRSYARF